MKKFLTVLLGGSLSPQPNSSGFFSDADSVFTGVEVWCTNGKVLSARLPVNVPKGTNPKIPLPHYPEATFVVEGFSNNLYGGLVGRLVPQKGTNDRGDVRPRSSLWHSLKKAGYEEKVGA